MFKKSEQMIIKWQCSKYTVFGLIILTGVLIIIFNQHLSAKFPTYIINTSFTINTTPQSLNIPLRNIAKSPQFIHNCTKCSQKFNISYDRESNCLFHTYDYVYPLQYQLFNDPLIIWEWNYTRNPSLITPDYSIIITVYDTLNVADRVIESIMTITRGTYELIIVFDAVDNSTINIIQDLIATFDFKCNLREFINPKSTKNIFMQNQEYLEQITLIYEYCIYHKKTPTWKTQCGFLQRIVLIQAWGIWETSANNLGMCISSENTKYFIHVQDDMQMTQIGWNTNMILPLAIFDDDLFSISGRCAGPIQNGFESRLHSIDWKSLKMPMEIAKQHGAIAPGTMRPVGRCGLDIDNPLKRDMYDKSIVHERSNSNVDHLR